jgi:hypothetical protein
MFYQSQETKHYSRFRMVTWFKNKLNDKLTRNCYTSVDTLPIWKWVAVHEKNDLSYLFKGERKKVYKWQLFILNEVWKSIYDEYVTRYGFSEAMLDMLRKQKQIAKMKVRRWATKDENGNLIEDEGQITFIQIAERELETMRKVAHSKDNFFSQKPWMEKLLGFRINIHKVSVAEWMDYCETCKQLVKNKAA